MVVEHSHVLSLDEIKALRFRCKKCKAATSFRLNETINFPMTCPGCRETLHSEHIDGGDQDVLGGFPRVLKALMERQKERHYEVLLEIGAPEK